MAMNMNLHKLQEMVRDREAWLVAVHDKTGQVNNRNDRLYVISGLPPHNPITSV